ncbi:MAG: hypothetical protein WC441_04790 [Patescibacteria group bacterium]
MKAKILIVLCLILATVVISGCGVKTHLSKTIKTDYSEGVIVAITETIEVVYDRNGPQTLEDAHIEIDPNTGNLVIEFAKQKSEFEVGDNVKNIALGAFSLGFEAGFTSKGE